MNRLTMIVSTLACCVWAQCEAAAPSSDVHPLLQQAAAGSWRSDANKARDEYRHPVETLEFFGLKPDMTVVELAPGGGWFTEILAPVLRDNGQLIAATGNLNGDYAKKLAGNPAVFAKVKLKQFSPPANVNLGANGSVDMVLTFRNLHDWLMVSAAELDGVFKAAFDVLKPGGVLGIEEHRARPNVEDAEQSAKTLHRIPEGYVISLALAHGFELAGVSQINSNPKDDESLNVHMLLPDLGGGESVRAIGESDRMTLKFVKPAR
jgi:predicted methyltransferase